MAPTTDRPEPPSAHAALPSAGVTQVLAWLLGRYERVRVQGHSMAPCLKDGAVVLIDRRALRRRPPRLGEIVLARHPYQSDLELLKRVARLEADGACFLTGDAAEESTDSRSFGALAPSALLGVAVAGFGRGRRKD